MPTTLGGLWFPGPGDPIVPISTVLQNMQNSVDAALGVPLYATTAARDTAFTARPFGMCVVGASYDAGTWYMRTGGQWYIQDPSVINQTAQSYVPVLTASTTNPTGQTCTGYYIRIGKFVNAWMIAVLSSSVGVGNYTFSLPINADPAYISFAGSNWIGNGCTVTQGTQRAFGQPRVLTSTVNLAVTTAFNSISNVNNTVPFAMASGGILTAQVGYEVV